MENSPPTARSSVLIDIERERQHWKDQYHALPRARAMRSFVRYWPVLCAAYDVYLNHPRADEGEGRRLFLERDSVQASPLNETEAGEVFERVWERIRGGQGRRLAG